MRKKLAEFSILCSVTKVVVCFLLGMTEVTTDTTDRNDRLVAVGGIGNYAVSCANISQ